MVGTALAKPILDPLSDTHYRIGRRGSSPRSPAHILFRGLLYGRVHALTEVTMSSSIEALILDLVEWVAKEPRSYADVMDAWRTSCPRLTVWEDAVDRKLVQREATAAQGVVVKVTDRGRDYLAENRRAIVATGQRAATAPVRAATSQHT
jgi:hypothetical protein